jgi:hypothetical protein
VRRIIVVLVAAFLTAFASGAAPAARSQVVSEHGIHVTVPSSWHQTRKIVSDCASPTQVLALTNPGRGPGSAPAPPKDHGLIVVLEDGIGGSGFPARTTFSLPAHPSRMAGCCGMPQDEAYEFLFRDQGRDFYAVVYAASRSYAEEAVAILNTLRIGT